jgi:hypothetical protein
MSSLNAIPGYNEAEAAYWQADSQFITAGVQLDAAIEQFGINSSQANQYRQQRDSALQQQENAQKTLAQIRDSARTANADLASPTVTTGQSQSTPAPNARDDGPTQAPTSGGVGAGTSRNAADSRGPDNTPPASSNTAQQIINQTFANQRIVAQPNVLDQYASYTYAISWWLLTPGQYNSLTTGLAPAPGSGNWSLLMQSGGAPIKGRNQFFPLDYYLDDLEIETFLMGKGTGMSTNGMTLKFKVVEPNGLTLIQNLYSAVQGAALNTSAQTTQQAAAGGTTPGTVNANQTSQAPNYGAAQYCLTIEFYGYDDRGNLIAPARGQVSTTGQLATTNPQSVIKKYYPFLIENITFRTMANQVEYYVMGNPVPYDTGTSQARGTIPFAFQLSGQTVGQLLQGGPATPATAQASPGERTSRPAPNMNEVIAASNQVVANTARVDANGNFTGETENPFAVVAP